MKWLVLAVLVVGCDGSLVYLPPAATYHVATGPLAMVGTGDSACSQPPPGSGHDVWCAFTRAGSTTSAAELWAVDVSRAATNGVTCDDTSPYCLRLSTTLWTGAPLFSPAYPGVDEFWGETLFIYSDSTSATPDDPFVGTVRAWRPGWSAPRPVSSAQGYVCRGHPSAAVGYCIDSVDQTTTNVQFDLRAGVLADAEGGPLATVAHVRALGNRNAQVMWGATFSPDGQQFAYSAPTDQDVEVLQTIKTAEVGKSMPTPLLQGAARWQLSADGKRVYYLRAFNYDDPDQMPSGTLASVAFPAGGNPQDLEPKVGDFLALGQPGSADQGLGFLQDMNGGEGTLSLLDDPGHPDQSVKLDDRVEQFQISPDLRYSFVFKPDEADGQESLIVRSDGQARCPLNTRPGSLPYLVTFLSGPRQVFFAEDGDDGQTHGWYTDPEGCQDKHHFATKLAYLAPVNDGIVYGEQDSTGRTMVIKHAPIDTSGVPDEGGDVIVQAADTQVALANKQYIVFTISQGDPGTLGLYIYGPMP